MNSMLFKRKSPLIVFLVPAFAMLALFLFYPFIMNIYNSFSDAKQLGYPAGGYNGGANYQKLFNDANMGTAVKNTLLMITCTVVFQCGIALILALMTDKIRFGRRFFRTVYFIPTVISGAVLGQLFNLAFLKNGGMLNELLARFGADRINWKEDYSLIAMIIPIIWQYIGFYFVIIRTGLKNIPGTIYEVSAIDGASGLQRIRYITLPLLYPVLTTCLILAITGALRVFDLPWTMFPNGIPAGRTFLMGTYMFYTAFFFKDAGYASAIAVLIAALAAALSRTASLILKPKDD